MVRWPAGKIPDKKAEIEQAARWAAYFENQGTDDYLLTVKVKTKTSSYLTNWKKRTDISYDSV